MAQTLPELKLTYHNGPRARAEPIRLMLAYRDIAYEYERIDRPQWVETEKAKSLYGQLPALTVRRRQAGPGCAGVIGYVSSLLGSQGAVPGLSEPPEDGVVSKTIYQTGTICRYIAGLLGLVPADPLEAAECDAVFEFGMDNCFVITRRRAGHPYPGELSKEKFFNQEKAEFGTKVFKEIRATMERVLGYKKFFCSDSQPYYCDFIMYHALVCALDCQPDCLDGAKALLAFRDRMEGLNGVAEYMAAEPWKPVRPPAK